MASENEEIKSPRPREDEPLDPALAAQLKIAEAEIRSHMESSSVWTPKRVGMLMTLIAVSLLFLGAVFLIAKVMGKH